MVGSCDVRTKTKRLVVFSAFQRNPHRELVHGPKWQRAGKAGSFPGEPGGAGMCFSVAAGFLSLSRGLSVFSYLNITRLLQNEDVRPHIRKRFRLHNLLPPDWSPRRWAKIPSTELQENSGGFLSAFWLWWIYIFKQRKKKIVKQCLSGEKDEIIWTLRMLFVF